MAINEPTITARFWHDTSPARLRKDGTYPVRIIIYSNRQRKNKAYPTPFHFTPDDFESIYLTSKPRNVHKRQRDVMDRYRTELLDTAKGIRPFTFDRFEGKLKDTTKRRTGGMISDYLKAELMKSVPEPTVTKYATSAVVRHYDQRIHELADDGRYGSRNSHLCSIKSILNFLTHDRKGDQAPFTFDDITPKFLKKYERHMNANGYTANTVGIYLRDLRAIYNHAIKAGNADRDLYPFQKDRFKIPAGSKVNKALTPDEITAIIKAKPASADQAKARDYFLFSYFSNGMNLIDIIHLRRGDIDGDKFTFIREKTKRTNAGHQKPITVFLNDYTSAIIDRQGGTDKRPKAFVFPIFDGIDDQETRYRKVKNFTRYVNQHIKSFASAVGISPDISSYFARHSFANNMRNNGTPIQITMELMGHNNEKTHRAYLDSIPDEKVRNAVNDALLKNITADEK